MYFFTTTPPKPILLASVCISRSEPAIKMSKTGALVSRLRSVRSACLCLGPNSKVDVYLKRSLSGRAIESNLGIYFRKYPVNPRSDYNCLMSLGSRKFWTALIFVAENAIMFILMMCSKNLIFRLEIDIS